MKFEISTEFKPSEEELMMLFLQTSWAKKRSESDIRKLLEYLDVFVSIRTAGTLIGFGRAISDGVYRALLDDIIVDQKFRKKGLGEIIVSKLLEQLNGVDQIFLNTKPELEEYYSQFGFLKFKSLTLRK